ncbi:uncharacterized protein BXIN_1556 [Babesia sp. Xinjiang]|uniref:uncharacterized protein n=1 Tax=Babesia sp. Xinjiang TaxID=462227 RepID=UPI000A241F15|nr:uncharacterized protein BXIN_1556 [Babesia sp. Xinjiang]ORM42309.1 hypothetical protein BXIN_1556 [Babesia sp. Xinjiang]
MLYHCLSIKCVWLLIVLLWNPFGKCIKSSVTRRFDYKQQLAKGALKRDIFTFVSCANTRKVGSNDHSTQSPLPTADINGVDKIFAEPIVANVQDLIRERGCLDPGVIIDTTSRLKYNGAAILDTFTAARETDEALTGTTSGGGQQKFCMRFDGDDGVERKLVASKTIDLGGEVAKVRKSFCFSLSQIKDDLFSLYDRHKRELHHESFECVYWKHIIDLQRLNIGHFMRERNVESAYSESGPDASPTYCYQLKDAHEVFEASVCSSLTTSDDAKVRINSTTAACVHARNPAEGGDSENHARNGFEERLCDFIRLKRLKLLKTLIVIDSVLSTGDALSVAMGSKEFALADLNCNEKELLLLSLGIASEYYNAVFRAVMCVMRQPIHLPSLCIDDTLKLSWAHHLLTKNMSHLPLLMPESAAKQIQEPIVSHRLRQRHKAVNDVIAAATNPLYVIRDRVEHLAQSHYKIEDTAPLQHGCGPLMTNRKIMAEMALENIESELLAFENDNGDYLGLFQVTSEDIQRILGDDYYQLPRLVGDSTVANIMDFFGEYLTGVLEPERYKHVTPDSWLMALDNLVTRAAFTRLFAAVVSHNLRAKGEVETDIRTAYTSRTFLHHAAPGISVARPVESSVYNSNHDVKPHEAHIVPFIDLINHSSGAPNCVIELDTDEVPHFRLRALHSIQPGEEILVNYGDLDNNVLFLDYGMVPTLNRKCGVFMEVEPTFIRRAAGSRGLEHLLPSSFPAGLPSEKCAMLHELGIFDIPSDKGFLALYNEPYFEGMPLEKYNEFTAKFLARENTSQPSVDEYLDADAIRQEHTKYQPPTDELFPSTDGSNQRDPMKIVSVDTHGVPDERLIMALKICFCKTKKRLHWLSQQDAKYLATSINSPLDIEIFRIASFVCCEYIKTKYQATIADDLRQASNPDLFRACGAESLSGVATQLEAIRKHNTVGIPNAVVLAHALRAKVPLYRCASYFDAIADDFERKWKT